jgi:hypothetical protein
LERALARMRDGYRRGGADGRAGRIHPLRRKFIVHVDLERSLLWWGGGEGDGGDASRA